MSSTSKAKPEKFLRKLCFPAIQQHRYSCWACCGSIAAKAYGISGIDDDALYKLADVDVGFMGCGRDLKKAFSNLMRQQHVGQNIKRTFENFEHSDDEVDPRVFIERLKKDPQLIGIMGYQGHAWIIHDFHFEEQHQRAYLELIDPGDGKHSAQTPESLADQGAVIFYSMRADILDQPL